MERRESPAQPARSPRRSSVPVPAGTRRSSFSAHAPPDALRWCGIFPGGMSTDSASTTAAAGSGHRPSKLATRGRDFRTRCSGARRLVPSPARGDGRRPRFPPRARSAERPRSMPHGRRIPDPVPLTHPGAIRAPDRRDGAPQRAATLTLRRDTRIGVRPMLRGSSRRPRRRWDDGYRRSSPRRRHRRGRPRPRRRSAIGDRPTARRRRPRSHRRSSSRSST